VSQSVSGRQRTENGRSLSQPTNPLSRRERVGVRGAPSVVIPRSVAERATRDPVTTRRAGSNKPLSPVEGGEGRVRRPPPFDVIPSAASEPSQSFWCHPVHSGVQSTAWKIPFGRA